MKLICKICKYDIATIDPLTRAPMQGSMFTSKDPKHGFPPPWSPVITPLHMYCPMCSKRPFDLQNEHDPIVLLTTEGEMLVTEDGLLSAVDAAHKAHDDKLKMEAEANRELHQKEIASKDVELASPDAPDAVATEVPTQPSEASGDTTAAQDEPVDDGDHSRLLTPEAQFDLLLREGKIIQHGSWYEYEGDNHRKDDIIKILSD